MFKKADKHTCVQRNKFKSSTGAEVLIGHNYQEVPTTIVLPSKHT